MLSEINAHPRDAFVSFEEEHHLYTIEGVPEHPISVTTLIHKFFPKFDADKIIEGMMKKSTWKTSEYYGMTPEEIKKQWEDNGKLQSGLGTEMHKAIEDYINDEALPKKLEPIVVPSVEQCNATAECTADVKIPTVGEQTTWVLPEVPSMAIHTKEFGFFLNFWRDLSINYPGFRPYRTEWTVYDIEKFISGNIDLVLINENGDLFVCDWKRSKGIDMEAFKCKNGAKKTGSGVFSHLDHCNYQHYSIQLNIYRHLIELHYGKKVVGMNIIVFHPNNDEYIIIDVRRMDKEMTDIWDLLPIANDGH